MPGKIMNSKKIPPPNLQICEYVNLYGKRDFTDVSKVTNHLILKEGDYPVWLGWVNDPSKAERNTEEEVGEILIEKILSTGRIQHTTASFEDGRDYKPRKAGGF